MPVNEALVFYTSRYFLDRREFLRSANITDSFFQDLLDGHALPGPIYRLWENGSYWSPIGGQIGTIGSGDPETELFSPAAIWWARRAKVLAASEDLSSRRIAPALYALFHEDFAHAVRDDTASRYGYPDLFENGMLREERIDAVVLSEWNDWINGGYGVCLKRFDAFHLIAKTNESARIRAITDGGRKDELSPAETMDLLDALDRLDAVMLPFAPHQRPLGTPGKWVDAILAKYQLGSIPLLQGRPDENLRSVGERYCA